MALKKKKKYYYISIALAENKLIEQWRGAELFWEPEPHYLEAETGGSADSAMQHCNQVF